MDELYKEPIKNPVQNPEQNTKHWSKNTDQVLFFLPSQHDNQSLSSPFQSYPQTPITVITALSEEKEYIKVLESASPTGATERRKTNG